MAKKPSRAKRKASGSKRPTRVTRATSAKSTRRASAKKIERATQQPVSHKAPLVNSWRIAGRAVRVLWRNRLLFALIVLVYIILNLVLVHSLTAFNVSALKSATSQSLQHGAGLLLGGFTVYASLFSSAATSSGSNAFQFCITVIVSLATIWSLRQALAARPGNLRLQAAFYNSTGQLIPFILILLLIGIELLPLLLGATLYSLVVSNGIAINLIQQLIFLAILLALAALSLFWLTTSAVALYIVTLSDMTPIKALRSAKELVRGRRLSVARKLIFLPIILFVVAAILVVPCILIWPPLAQVVFWLLSMIGLVAVHAYLYTLYRGLLNE